MKKNSYLQLILDFTFSGFFILISMITLNFILPKGLTTEFLFRGSKLVSIACVILTLIFILSWILNKNFKFKKKFEIPEFKDLILVTLPISPVLDYLLFNIEYLNIFGFFYLVGIVLLFILLLGYIFPIIFSYFVSIKILMISGLALSFTILTMAKISSNPNSHIFESQFVTQGLYLIISFGVLYLIYFFNKKIAYFSVILFMTTGLFISLLSYYSKNSLKDKNQFLINLLIF